MITAAVIPARNEAKRIRSVVEQTRLHVDYVVIVDDGSNDGTADMINDLGETVVVLQHDVNLGKGAALKTGCDAALLLKADVIVTLDADGQHNPASIPGMIKQLQDDKLDIVFGMRQFNSKMPMMMLIGNQFLSKLISFLFKVMIHDTQSGYRVFTAHAYKDLRWHSTGYEAETEMIVRTGDHHLHYAEFDIATIYHDNYKGTTVFDGIKILLQILRWKFI